MDAIIGVIGTILGTILGWVLNSVSSRGKLKIFVSSWNEKFQHNDRGSIVPSKSKEQSEYYHYNLTLDLYNSSGETKIMRSIEVAFSDGKSIIYKSIPQDDDTKHCSGPRMYYDDVVPLNIPPKTITQLKLNGGLWRNRDGLDFIWKTQAIYLTYLDEKGKAKKVFIKEENYANHFDSQD